MQTLTYGHKKPENSDTGDQIFPALADNVDLDDAHNHDGITSALVNIFTQVIPPVGWVVAAGGMFTQDVVMPAGYLYDERIISFRLSTGEPIFADVERIDASTYRVTVNDNTLGLVAYYG